MKLDNPPPFDEYIEMDEWSLTDPVTGPNPKAIDVVLNIKNLGDAALEGLYVDISYQWKVGPISSPKTRRWEEPQLFHEEVIHYLPAHASRQIKISQFLLWEKQESVPNGSWTWALKIICKVKVIRKVQELDAEEQTQLTVERVLPIIPGD